MRVLLSLQKKMIVETKTHCCSKCQSPNIVRNGSNKSGTAQYKCKNCGTCRVLIKKAKTQKIDIGILEKTYTERNSLRSVGRLFDISHVSVFNMLKKSPKFS
jgi:transposase-like protein